jgi:DNA-binding ferritin-like protein (Dps family)
MCTSINEYIQNVQKLVGGAIPILKNISQWEGLSHILWKIKKMFETTNQKTYSEKLPTSSNVGSITHKSTPRVVGNDVAHAHQGLRNHTKKCRDLTRNRIRWVNSQNHGLPSGYD